MSTANTPAIESLTAQVFGLISTAQRNGMVASDAVAVGIRPFLAKLLDAEIERDALRTANAELVRVLGEVRYKLDYISTKGEPTAVAGSTRLLEECKDRIEAALAERKEQA